MDKDEPNRFLYDDPTATEVEDALRRERELAERNAEYERRRQWDQDHGLIPGTIEGEAWEETPELEQGDE